MVVYKVNIYVKENFYKVGHLLLHKTNLFNKYIMTKVSVIIPMYNEECYIWRCLKSLKEQTFKNFEIILIDDGSKDDTIKIAESFKNDFQLTILEQKHWWQWKARNRWAKEAKWEILIFVDADMYFDKNYIKYLIQPILDWKEIWTWHWTELVGNLGNSIATAYGVVRWVSKEWERSGIYRAILKKTFIDAWWFNINRWYFDDDLSKVNNWKWSYMVEKAICYHNNPESLKEIFKHEIRVWKGFTQKEILLSYIRTYKVILLCFTALLLALLIFAYCTWQRVWILYWIIILLLLFFVIKIYQRSKFDKRYTCSKKHLKYIPLVMIVRGGWNFVWFCKWLFTWEKL